MSQWRVHAEILSETSTEMSVGLGGGGWFCSGQEARGREGCNVRNNQSATREGLTKRNDHVDCVTVPSFS